MNLLQRKI